MQFCLVLGVPTIGGRPGWDDKIPNFSKKFIWRLPLEWGRKFVRSIFQLGVVWRAVGEVGEGSQCESNWLNIILLLIAPSPSLSYLAPAVQCFLVTGSFNSQRGTRMSTRVQLAASRREWSGFLSFLLHQSQPCLYPGLMQEGAFPKICKSKKAK